MGSEFHYLFSSIMNYSWMAYLKNVVANVRAIAWMYRDQSFSVFRQLISEHFEAKRRACRMARSKYRVLDHAELSGFKKTRRVFVFGSGYSLNVIPDAEWSRIAGYDTIGFSGSFHLQKVPITYHLFRGWVESTAGSLAWQQDAAEISRVIDGNPWLKDTVFVFQEGFTAIFSNRLIGYEMLDPKYRIAFFLPDKLTRLPHRNMRQGLAHRMTGLCSAVSLAVAQGYDEIVLTGVDLYDSRYFWLPPDKTLGWSEIEQRLVPTNQNMRGISATGTHNTVNNGIIRVMGEWHCHLKDRYGVELSVYNPISLLTETVPVFSWN